MSDFLQSGVHPDADQLNAFAEHVLPPHEQEQMLAHLAVCPECRSALSFALPPIEESAHRHVPPVRRRWFSGWNLLWPVAVTLAALVPIAIHVRNTSSSSNEKAQTEIAASHPPAAIAPPTPEPAPELKEARTAKGVSGQSAAKEPPAKLRRHLDALEAPTVSPRGSRDAASESSNVPGRSLQNFVGGDLGGGVRAAPVSPKPGSGNRALGAAAPAAARLPETAGGGAGMGIASQATNLRNADFAPIETGNSAAQRTLKVAALSPLPSGLPIMSTTSTGHVTLALDTQSTLFYSDDAGRQWKVVQPPWKGNAIMVNLANNIPQTVLHGAMQGYAGNFGAGAPVEHDAKSVAPLSSSVAGTVTDPTGAAIPNASVAVHDTARQTLQSTKADASGQYLIRGLPAGTYQMTAEAPGFRKLELPITLASSQQNVSNLQLQVGAVSETVAVESERLSLDRKSLAKKAPAPPAPTQPEPLFEITTDTGDHWVSLDGQNWTHK